MTQSEFVDFVDSSKSRMLGSYGRPSCLISTILEEGDENPHHLGLGEGIKNQRFASVNPSEGSPSSMRRNVQGSNKRLGQTSKASKQSKVDLEKVIWKDSDT